MTRDGVPRRDDFPFQNVRAKVAIIGGESHPTRFRMR